MWGTPLQPFLGTRGFVVEWAWAVPALLVLGLCVWQAVRIAAPGHGSSRAFVLWALGLALVSRLAVNTARLGPDGWIDMFAGGPEAQNEYLPALPRHAGRAGPVPRPLRRVAARPPRPHGGPTRRGSSPRWSPWASTMRRACRRWSSAWGVLTAPLTYWVGRELAGEGTARLATVLWIFAPSALLYGASAADALFATLGVLAAAVLVLRPPAHDGGERAAAIGGRAGRATARALRRVALPVGAALLAVASFFAWSLLGMAAWAAFVVWGRDGPRRAIALGALCAAALVAFYAGLWALTGYDVIGTLRRVEEVYRFSVASVRPYAFWLFGSPAASSSAVGCPSCGSQRSRCSAAGAGAVAIAGVIVIASVLGFTPRPRPSASG